MEKHCTFKVQSPKWAIMCLSGYKQHSQPEAKAIPGGPVVKNLHFHHRGKELRSCMMPGSAKKKKKKKEEED